MPNIFYLRNATAAEPCPNAMVDTTYTFDGGTYTAAKTLQPTLGVLQSVIANVGVGVDNNTHYIRATNFMTEALTYQNIPAQTWEVSLHCRLASLLNFVVVNVMARLFVWSSGDTLSTFIGSTGSAGPLTDTDSTHFTINIAAPAIVIPEGGKIGVDIYFQIIDSTSETPQLAKPRIDYGETDHDSYISSPEFIGAIGVSPTQIMMGKP